MKWYIVFSILLALAALAGIAYLIYYFITAKDSHEEDVTYILDKLVVQAPPAAHIKRYWDNGLLVFRRGQRFVIESSLSIDSAVVVNNPNFMVANVSSGSKIIVDVLVTAPLLRWELLISFKDMEDTFLLKGYIIYNPWNPDDNTYMPNPENDFSKPDPDKYLSEYIENENAFMFQGSSTNYSASPWQIGQFDHKTLELIFMLLDVASTDMWGKPFDKSDPAMVMRYLVNQINTLILMGNWSDSSREAVFPDSPVMCQTDDDCLSAAPYFDCRESTTLKKASLCYLPGLNGLNGYWPNPEVLCTTDAQCVGQNGPPGWSLGAPKCTSAEGRACGKNKSPSMWTSVSEIVERWFKDYNYFYDGIAPLNDVLASQVQVKYGQCWVFSAIVLSFSRALGVPCRSVSIFGAGHPQCKMWQFTGCNSVHQSPEFTDTLIEQGKNTGLFYNATVWNFHVTNDIFIQRQDDKKYSGWNLIDATPQESSYGLWMMGPAPLSAIRDKEMKVPSDTSFGVAECNYKIVHWMDQSSPPTVRTSFSEWSWGQNHMVSSTPIYELPIDYIYQYTQNFENLRKAGVWIDRDYKDPENPFNWPLSSKGMQAARLYAQEDILRIQAGIQGEDIHVYLQQPEKAVLEIYMVDYTNALLSPSPLMTLDVSNDEHIIIPSKQLPYMTTSYYKFVLRTATTTVAETVHLLKPPIDITWGKGIVTFRFVAPLEMRQVLFQVKGKNAFQDEFRYSQLADGAVIEIVKKWLQKKPAFRASLYSDTLPPIYNLIIPANR
jgi:hypothetical protein